MYKFYDDPMVNESKIIGLLAQIWMYVDKREDFGRGRRETNLRGRKSVEMYRKCKM